ncbi:MAG TPA: hypothetical protein GX747_01960, partial [Tenericutes bacterium]|nr:hypothetical protein [Mycoplasmatota bacterium]
MRKIKLLIIGITTFCIFGFITNVSAATANISITSSKSTVIVGNNVTFSVTISSSAALGSWDIVVGYDTSKLTFISSTASGLRAVDYASAANKKSVTYTYTFRAKASGNATVSISNASVVDFDTESYMTVNKGSRSIKIMTQAELEATYSKNNYLSSLTVDKGSLNPVFNKQTLDYTVELEPETKNITINGTKEDSKSSISGLGEKELVEGSNRIEIKVTAENGNVRTYSINVVVKEYEPINIKIDNKDFTVVRKSELIEAPSGFDFITVKYDKEDVPALYNEITKFTLVALKDSEGNINLYVYDKTNNSYKLYNEYSFNKTVLYLEDYKGEIPKKYKKYSINLFDTKINVYKTKETSRFALIYGMNTETGEKSLYIYDDKENTIQRYNNELELI